MNNQPKPATDPWREIEVAEKYLKDKYQMDNPATDCSAEATQSKGEWTVASVSALMSNLQGALACRVIADAHNAVLAEATDPADQEILLLRQQLAAERNIGWNEGREHERKCNEAQLAAEREKNL